MQKSALLLVAFIASLRVTPSLQNPRMASTSDRFFKRFFRHTAGESARPEKAVTRPCVKRRYEKNFSFVCVCNATYCDEPEPMGRVAAGHFVSYVSTPSGDRFRRIAGRFEAKNPSAEESTTADKVRVDIFVNASAQWQRIFGFGGAFTDSAGINFRSLSKATQRSLMEAYFGKNGIGYSIGRVPIASSDFSLHEYSYLDTADDFNLTSFALTVEDHMYKIPYIKQATSMVGEDRIRLLSSPWSAPGWMKTNGRMKGGGRLRGEFNGKYYKTYAAYFRKFLEEYHKQGVPFWALTIENEPGAGLNPDYRWQAMAFTPKMQRDFAYDLLSPELKKSPSSEHVKIIAHDDQRALILDAAKEIYADPQKSQVIAGLAVHWYSFSEYTVLSRVHAMQPDKFILATEACTADQPGEGSPLLGNWERGMRYGVDIINDLLNWVIGWTDWNLALDTRGGPNWVGNFVDAPIIVNATADEFYKQPMFYFLGHFSKFIPRDSVRIGSRAVVTSDGGFGVEHAAFQTPDGHRVLVVINRGELAQCIYLHDEQSNTNNTAHVVIEAHGIATIVYRI